MVVEKVLMDRQVGAQELLNLPHYCLGAGGMQFTWGEGPCNTPPGLKASRGRAMGLRLALDTPGGVVSRAEEAST